MTEREKEIRERLGYETANRARLTGVTSLYLDDMRYLLDEVERLRGLLYDAGKLGVDMVRNMD